MAVDIIGISKKKVRCKCGAILAYGEEDVKASSLRHWDPVEKYWAAVARHWTIVCPNCGKEVEVTPPDIDPFFNKGNTVMDLDEYLEALDDEEKGGYR